MNAEPFKAVGIEIAKNFFARLEPVFEAEEFINAAQMKLWLGHCIKVGASDGYRNLEWKEYKILFDYIVFGRIYHVGIDFGQQAVHVTLGPNDVYSLYYRNPTVPEW